MPCVLPAGEPAGGPGRTQILPQAKGVQRQPLLRIAVQRGSLSVGGVICELLQPPTQPKRHQVRHTQRMPQLSSRRDLPASVCRLRTGSSTQSKAMVTIDQLLASAVSGLDQPTINRNSTYAVFIDQGCLNCSSSVIFPGSHRPGWDRYTQH